MLVVICRLRAVGNDGGFAGDSLAATVVCMGASPGVMASVGGQTKNAGLKFSG